MWAGWQRQSYMYYLQAKNTKEHGWYDLSTQTRKGNYYDNNPVKKRRKK